VQLSRKEPIQIQVINPAAPPVILTQAINPAAPPVILTQAINPVVKELTAVIKLLAAAVILIRVINLVDVNISSSYAT
jgi:hypothetical protein